MADEVVTGETPEKAEGAQAAPEAEEFDKDRALATIKKLREFEKEAKANAKKLEAYEKAETERKAAEMTEAQKLQARLEKLEAEKTDAITRANARVLRAEIIAKAGDFHDPEDVYLALKDKLSVGDDGEVEGLDKALADLKASKKHWLKGKSPQLHGGNPGQNANGQEETREQRRARLHI